MSEELPEGCPACGALPCDWVNDPHALTAEVEALRGMLRDWASHTGCEETCGNLSRMPCECGTVDRIERSLALLNKEPAR
jgi:hypothetical protein